MGKGSFSKSILLQIICFLLSLSFLASGETIVRIENKEMLKSIYAEQGLKNSPSKSYLVEYKYEDSLPYAEGWRRGGFKFDIEWIIMGEEKHPFSLCQSLEKDYKNNSEYRLEYITPLPGIPLDSQQCQELHENRKELRLIITFRIKKIKKIQLIKWSRKVIQAEILTAQLLKGEEIVWEYNSEKNKGNSYSYRETNK